MKNPENIVITGASSGLGAALAAAYAAPGITLHLAGRNGERLQSVARACQERGAMVYFRCVDVTDAGAMAAWLSASDAVGPVDLVVANAGISAGIGGGGESAEQARAIFSINVGGVINTIQPLLGAMARRRRGQIAIIGSLAGLRGLSSSPAYSASKACVRVYGEGLRGWLAAYGIEVSVVCPGFIKTPMTDVNPYRMPFMMSADKAARIIRAGLEKNRARLAFPRRLYWPLWLLTCLPVAWTDPLFNRLPDKPAL